MVAHAQAAAHNAIGIIGNIISFGLFLSPVPTFRRIIQKKDVEEYQPYPYVATVQNCLFWVYYGLPFVTSNSILVTTINSIGLAIEIVYLSIFLWFCRDKKQLNIVLVLVGLEVLLTVGVVLGTLLGVHEQKRRSLIVGILADIFNVMMYASPILIANKVIKTKSVEYMPIYLSIANFANGLIWTSFALIMFDPFVLASNALGTLFGVCQLILYFYYYFKYPRKKETDVVKPSEVQLSGANAV